MPRRGVGLTDEVANVYPDPVIRNEASRIHGVRYDELASWGNYRGLFIPDGVMQEWAVMLHLSN